MSNSDLNIESSLLNRISTGEENAYKVLFDTYFDRLKWYAFKFLKSEFWAEEVVQEVFIKVWKGREQLTAVESVSAYLFRMTGNRCLNRLRRQQLESEMQYAAHVVLHGKAEVLQHSGYDLARLQEHLQEAVDHLPEQRRLIYQLQQEGLTYQEIADRLEISRHTVRNQMAKALVSIRAYLVKQGPFILALFNYWYFL